MTLARALGVNPSRYADEILEIMTGVSDGAGSNPSDFCGNPPTAGRIQTAQQIVRFGSFFIKTQLNVVPLAGEQRHRADVPREILNAGAGANPLIPDVLYRMTDTASPLANELFTVGIELERALERVLITGDITQASSAAERGFMKEFNGLDLLIKTGYTDAVSGALVPAMDSAVLNFNAAVTGTTADGRNITEALVDMVYGLRERAVGVGMDTAQFAIVMRRELFRALADEFACDYATYRCAGGGAGDPVTRDAFAVQQLRLEMARGQYLLVDGQPVPVIFSDGVPRDTVSANTYQSDLYIVALSWEGRPLLRLEYFDMNSSLVRDFAGFADADSIQTLNNGLHMVGVRSTGLCREYLIASRLRLIVETPFLCGRIDNVQHAYRAPSRDAYPGMSLYAGGGATYRG
jgi:hypothetical protein